MGIGTGRAASPTLVYADLTTGGGRNAMGSREGWQTLL